MSRVQVRVDDAVVPTLGPILVTVADFQRSDNVVQLRFPRNQQPAIGTALVVTANGTELPAYVVERTTVEQPRQTVGAARRDAGSARIIEAIAQLGTPTYAGRARLLRPLSQGELVTDAKTSSTDLNAVAKALREQLIRVDVDDAGVVSLARLTDPLPGVPAQLPRTTGVQRTDLQVEPQAVSLTETSALALLRRFRARYQTQGEEDSRLTPGDADATVLPEVHPTLARALDAVARHVVLRQLEATRVTVTIPLDLERRPRQLITLNQATWFVASVRHRLGPDRTDLELEPANVLDRDGVDTIFDAARELGLPPAVEGLATGVVGRSAVELVWDSFEDSTADGYTVMLGRTPAVSIPERRATNHLQQSLDPGQTYELTVRTYNDLAVSLPARVTVTLVDDFPTVPPASFIAGYNEFALVTRDPTGNRLLEFLNVTPVSRQRYSRLTQADLNVPDRCLDPEFIANPYTGGSALVADDVNLAVPVTGILLGAAPVTVARLALGRATAVVLRTGVLPRVAQRGATMTVQSAVRIRTVLPRIATFPFSLRDWIYTQNFFYRLFPGVTPYRTFDLVDLVGRSRLVGAANIPSILFGNTTQIAQALRFVRFAAGAPSIAAGFILQETDTRLTEEGLYIDFEAPDSGYHLERWELQYQWSQADGTVTQPWRNYVFVSGTQPSAAASPNPRAALSWLNVRSTLTDVDLAATRTAETDPGMDSNRAQVLWARRNDRLQLQLAFTPALRSRAGERFARVQFRARVVVDAEFPLSTTAPRVTKPGNTIFDTAQRDATRVAMDYTQQPDQSQVRFRASCWHTTEWIDYGDWL